MFMRFSLSQVLFACMAAFAVIPAVVMVVWDAWIADRAAEWPAYAAILVAGAAAAVGIGWVVSRRMAWEEDKVHRQQQHLAHSMRLTAMSEMAASIAHEINQPLAAVAAYVDGSIMRLKAGEAPGDDILDALNKAAEQARRAGTILRRVRMFVRDQAPARILVDLNAPVRDGLDVVRNEVHRAGAELDADFSDSYLPVQADAIHIQQIVVNIVRTILGELHDATREQRRIQILTTRNSDDTVRLAIRNGAANIARVSETRTLDPFFATDAGWQAMRLTICRTIAEAHEGKLLIERPADGGAFFELILPLGKPAP